MQHLLNQSPSIDELLCLMENAYWRRQWIVQEICLPRHLVFVHGSEIWLYENFRKIAQEATQSWASSKLLESSSFTAALRLLETRDKRDTEMMKFESLIERFAKSECSELRDRIYGLLGCANDIRPFAGQDERADTLKRYMDYLSSGLNYTVQPQRGIGSLKVDYSCSLYEIWKNVVGFAYFQAHDFERNVSTQGIGLDLIEERYVSVVRTAGIIQNLLDQKVDEECANHDEILVSLLGC
jgi:hypothetical protein